MYDPQAKELTCIGNIYAANAINFKTGQSDFSTNSKDHRFFIIKIDSLGNSLLRTEKPLPLPVTPGKLNAAATYHLKIREFNKLAAKKFAIWADLYELGSDKVLSYFSSWYLDISEGELAYEIQPAAFYVNTSAIPNFTSHAKGDLHGKFLLDDATQYDKFMYKKPLMPVVVETALDQHNNPFYILVKTNISAGTQTYYNVSVGKKGLESKIILASDKAGAAILFMTSPATYISCLADTEVFELKINAL